MSTLTNAIFRTLLGWLRTLWTMVWYTAASPQGTILGWIGAHWQAIALTLCALGLGIDLIVYLLRWQPYRVWRSYFRRRKARREAVETETESAMEISDENEAYLSGGETEWTEETSERIPSALEWEGDREQGFGAPLRERSWETPGEARFREESNVGWERLEPEGTTPTFEQAIRPRRRRMVHFFEEEQERKTATPDQLIDRYAAYRRPVYPRNWKAEKDSEEMEDE